MTDHHLVIQANSGPDMSGAKGRPVDTGIGPYLYVIVETDRPNLRFGYMDTGAAVSGKAKAVATDHHPVEKHNPVTERAVVGDHCPGVQDAVVTDFHIIFDDHSRMQDNPITDPYPVTDTDKRADGDLVGYFTVLADHSAVMDAPGNERRCQDMIMNNGLGKSRIADHNLRHCQAVYLPGNKTGRGRTVGKQIGLMHIKKKGQLTRSGQVNGI